MSSTHFVQEKRRTLEISTAAIINSKGHKTDVGNLPGHLLFSICLGLLKFQWPFCTEFFEKEAGSSQCQNLPANLFVSKSSNAVSIAAAKKLFITSLFQN